jgi:fluoroacetyl-CoA thioesterase
MSEAREQRGCMAFDLRPGLRHTPAITVREALTVPAVSVAFASCADMPPVFATAFMVGFVFAAT